MFLKKNKTSGLFEESPTSPLGLATMSRLREIHYGFKDPFVFSPSFLCTSQSLLNAMWIKPVAFGMLRDLIPRFWFPLSIGSDNGPTFVAELLQLVCKAVNIKWKLHTAYRPQSSGMVEGMNQTIKVTLIK